MKLESKLSKESLMFDEIKLKYYKDILKCLYGEHPDKTSFLSTIVEISSKITNKPKDFFINLNCFDFFLFLIDLRMSVLGPFCSINIQQNNKQMKLELDLNHLKEDLILEFNTILKQNLTCDEKIFVDLECPSFFRLFELSNNEYCLFIKKIIIKKESNSEITININSNKEADELLNQLQPKLSAKIIDFVKNFFEDCSKINLLKRYKLKESQNLHFVPSLDVLIWFLKLIFNEQLNVIYDNLFYLSYSGKMDLTHIENCTVGEYNYYVNLLKGILTERNEPPSNLNNAFEHGINESSENL